MCKVMPAVLPAKSLPAGFLLTVTGGQEPKQFQWVKPEIGCPPVLAHRGGQEPYIFQWVMPAVATYVLRRVPV
jgi:hypothetical protein